MLGRLLSGAGMVRAGVGMMRRGQAMRAAHKAAPMKAAGVRRSNIISKVKAQTRGIAGTSKGGAALFSKHTATGQKRRLAAAQAMRGKRAGLPAGMTHSSIASQVSTANRNRTRTIVRNVQGITNSIHPRSNMSKKTQAGRFSRSLVAQHLRAARKGPTQWGNMGPTYDLRRNRTP